MDELKPTEDLRQRCADILTWRKTGSLPFGAALRAFADQPRFDKHEPHRLHGAEYATLQEAAELIAALNTRAASGGDSASLEQRARECSACKGAGEVMLPAWTPDPQDGYERLGTCPKCGGNGGAFPQALESLLYFTEHCLSAADEGVDYSTSREWLDAMTTMGIMEKTGRGKWAPSAQAQPVVDALRAITAALANQQGVEKDAARYRWLRDNCFINQNDDRDFPHAVIMVQWFDGEYVCRMHPGHHPGVGIPGLDSAIDAAMSTQPAGDVGREGGNG